MTKINVINGMGREVNPTNFLLHNAHSVFLKADIDINNKLYNKFERTVQSYPCFDTTRKVVDSYEGEAELVWQWLDNVNGHDEWIDVFAMEYELYKTWDNFKAQHETTGIKVRQCYIIQPTAESKQIIGEDNICPVTKLPCDDECCPPGSECNISGVGSDPSVSGELIAEGKEPAKVRQDVPDNSDKFHEWLDMRLIQWKPNGHFTTIIGNHNVFTIGELWGRFYQKNRLGEM